MLSLLLVARFVVERLGLGLLLRARAVDIVRLRERNPERKLSWALGMGLEGVSPTSVVNWVTAKVRLLLDELARTGFGVLPGDVGEQRYKNEKKVP